MVFCSKANLVTVSKVARKPEYATATQSASDLPLAGYAEHYVDGRQWSVTLGYL